MAASPNEISFAVDLSSIMSGAVLLLVSVVSFFIKGLYTEHKKMSSKVSDIDKGYILIEKDLKDASESLRDIRNLKEELMTLKYKLDTSFSKLAIFEKTVEEVTILNRNLGTAFKKIDELKEEIETLQDEKKEMQRKMQIFFAKAEKAGWEFDERHFGG